MKKPFLIIISVTCFITTWGQIDVQLPKSPKTTIPIQNNVLANLATFSDFYIAENIGFWGLNTQTKKVAVDPCASAASVYRWKAINNGDGTVTIVSQVNNNLKMVYQKSALVIPRSAGAGLSGSASTQDGLYVIPISGAGSAPNPSYKTTDKWFLKKINSEDYRLVYPDRSDSFFIRIFTPSQMNAVNFSFNGLEGWTVTAGNAFTGQPSSVNYIPFFDSPVIPAMPLGGSYWKELENLYFSVNTKTEGRFINTSRPTDVRWAKADETKTGILTSMPFVICGDKMTFRIAGTDDATNIKFELLQKIPAVEPGAVTLPDGVYKIISSQSGHNNDITRKIVVNTAAQKYQVCRFRITDNSTAGHIIVDAIDLTFTGQTSSEPKPADPVIPAAKPIWGSIDMHTHPMSYLGMGGKLMHGKLDGNPNEALGNCNCTHGGWGTDNTCGNYLRAEIINLIDEHYTAAARLKMEDLKVPHNDHPHEGYPGLVRWPVQGSMTHQQMWYEWLKRAKDGGLTAIIALTVNSEVLARALGGDAPFDDKTAADRQIDELIAFVGRHRDFLDTVTSAARMRQVVRSGRMAVIIGMEIDNLGNFYQNVAVSNEQIRNEITRLKNKGVRYIFPIHVTDNKFGGAAVYKELFNFSNKYATGQPTTANSPNLYPPVLPGHLFNVETAPDRNIGFRLEGGTLSTLTKMRPLIELIEAGGFPVLPPIPPPPPLPPVPTLTELSLTVKVIVDPLIIALKLSQQYQLAKKIFLDRHPELAAYDGIKRSETDKGGHRNVLGLSTPGIFAVTEMMRQGMLIDVDHASEKSVNDMIGIAVASHNYPLNSGHNALRVANDNEKTRTREQLASLKNLGGMMGIGWENQTPAQFNSVYGMHLSLMGNKSTTFGSDIGGYAATTKQPASPSQFINYTNTSRPDYLQQYRMPGSPRVWDYNTEGMAHIGLVPDFFEALKKAGAPTAQLNALFLSAEYFAQMWEKCERTAPMIR